MQLKKRRSDMKSHDAYWLDLELRKDIDDYVTLIYALEQNVNIDVVSIHNPSIKELHLLNNTLNMFDSNALIVIAGELTQYPSDEDIHPSLEGKSTGVAMPRHKTLFEYIVANIEAPAALKPPPTVFCGGSLHTLSKLLTCFPDKHWQACIQGGYAGPSIVGEENVLKKFKRREQVPTWNLNLDLHASDIVMSASNLTARFVSKNVCHDAWVHKNDIDQGESLFHAVLKDYFSNNAWDNKCMHDLLAFMTELDESLVVFSPVDLKRSNDQRPKWSSSLNASSNKSISISFDKQIFSHAIKNYQAKNRVAMDSRVDTAIKEKIEPTSRPLGRK